MRRSFMLLAVVSIFGAACDDNPRPDGWGFCPGEQDLAALVDPLIGTRGSGNSTPAACVPHGMVKLGPDTLGDEKAVDAYEYNNERMQGFSHTQLQGPGGSANGYSQLLFLPTVDRLPTDPSGLASAFSHLDEEVSAGHYKVHLIDDDVRVELTATAHAGFHRYIFPASDRSHVLIDLGHSLGSSRDGQVDVVDATTIEGRAEYMVHLLIDALLNTLLYPDDPPTGVSTIYFHARFSKPMTGYGTWHEQDDERVLEPDSKQALGPWIGAWATFETTAKEPIEVRVGVSLISVEQARLNLETEIGEDSFEQVRDEARTAWNCVLNRIQVEGGSQTERVQFYSALYHSLMAPANYTEVGDVFFSAADGIGQVFTWPGRRFYTDDWCAWDTFRTSRPLATFLEPETVEDVVESYVHLYRQGGWLPKCTWHASGYSRVMIGNHAVAILADALVKGFDKFDLEAGWQAVLKSANEDNVDERVEGLCGYPNLGTSAEYIENGYVGHECDFTQAASMTLEYAYNDWCIAQMAAVLDESEAQTTFGRRAGNWQNHFNPAVGFMQGRRRDGSWLTPFDPTDMTETNSFCEADAWIYTWFVPHDVPGLIRAMGGPGAFCTKLDTFFDGGHFDPSNEPSFHAPFMYNRAGQPFQTQARVRAMLADSFSAEPDGLPGNDDAGATSAWYALSAMGLFPMAPGDGRYDLASPLFTKVTVHLNPSHYDAATFVIEAPEASEQNRYIQSASLDDKALDVPWIHHRDLARGATLKLEMGPQPSDWATDLPE